MELIEVCLPVYLAVVLLFWFYVNGSFLQSMLQVDYTLRPTAEAVKNRVKELMEAHGGY